MSAGPPWQEGHDAVREQAAQWFARLRADDVEEDDRVRWRQWMDRDPRHRQAYARLQAQWQEIGTWAGAPDIAARLAEIAPARVQSLASRRPVRRRPRVRRWLSAAAGLAALALVSTWWLQELRPDATEYATAVGESRTVLLDDGTRVDLDTDTRLRVVYSRRGRLVEFLQGRAHFDVVRDPDRPLRVDTALGEIRVVGTVFEVDQHAGNLDVTLVSGRVDVMPAGSGGGVEHLQPGDRFHIAQDGRQSRTASDGETAAWRTGRLVFDDLSLADAVAEFNRYRHARIALADPSLAEIRVSGAFRSGDPSGFIEALQLLHGVSSSSDPAGNVTLARK